MSWTRSPSTATSARPRSCTCSRTRSRARPPGRARPDGHDGPGVSVGLMLLGCKPNPHRSRRPAGLSLDTLSTVRTAAILPVKRFSQAKQRLEASVADPLRLDLARAMVGDVLARSPKPPRSRHVVVTNEHSSQTARAQGAMVIDDQRRTARARRCPRHRARTTEGIERMLCVPGDCPTLDPAELEALLALAPAGRSLRRRRRGRDRPRSPRHRHQRAADRSPRRDPPSFGPGSCERHRELALAASVRRV